MENDIAHSSDLHSDWDKRLRDWAKSSGTSEQFIDHGFWRWKVFPPKVRHGRRDEYSDAADAPDTLDLRWVKGVSPCVTGGYLLKASYRCRGRGTSKVVEALRRL